MKKRQKKKNWINECKFNIKNAHSVNPKLQRKWATLLYHHQDGLKDMMNYLRKRMWGENK